LWNLKFLEIQKYISKFEKSIVTEQGATEQNFCGCAFCVNARIADQGFKVNPAPPSLMRAADFIFFGEKVSVGYAWDAWRDCYLAVWDGIARRWRHK
jgi:hypothetical protein